MGFTVIIVSFLGNLAWWKYRKQLVWEDAAMRAGLLCMSCTLLYFLISVLVHRLG